MENNTGFTNDSFQQNTITESIIESYKEKIKSALSKLDRDFRRGYIGEFDYRKRFIPDLYNFFDSLLSDCNISFWGLSSNPFNYQAFMEDYNLWKAGQVPKFHTEMPWLVYGKKVRSTPLMPWARFESLSELSKNTSLQTLECSPIDKINFFRIMEGFLFQPAFFQKLPDNVPRQNIINRISYNNSTTLTIGRYCSGLRKDYWINDSNVLIENYHPGSNIVLTDIYGLKTKFTVINETDDIPNFVVEFVNPCTIRVFNACGSIEGYTSSRERELIVIFKNDSLFSISYDMIYRSLFPLSYDIKDDEKAVENCPLWKESFDFADKHISMLKEWEDRWISLPFIRT